MGGRSVAWLGLAVWARGWEARGQDLRGLLSKLLCILADDTMNVFPGGGCVFLLPQAHDTKPLI